MRRFGHSIKFMEQHESPEAAVIREAREETGATVENLRLVAYQRIELLGPKPDGYEYPYPVSYQALYVGDVVDLGVFQEEEDSVERGFFGLDEALARVPWAQTHSKLLALAWH